MSPDRLCECHWCEEHNEIKCDMRDSGAPKEVFATAVQHAIVLAPIDGTDPPTQEGHGTV